MRSSSTIVDGIVNCRIRRQLYTNVIPVLDHAMLISEIAQHVASTTSKLTEARLVESWQHEEQQALMGHPALFPPPFLPQLVLYPPRLTFTIHLYIVDCYDTYPPLSCHDGHKRSAIRGRFCHAQTHVSTSRLTAFWWKTCSTGWD